MKYELPSTELIVIEENNYLKFGEYLNDMQCDDTANKLSLDDLEYVKKLQQENKILKENAENNDKVVDKVNWKNQLLKKENKQLKDNWNMLKEHLTNRYNNGTESISYRQVFVEIREAMQVLEIQQELEQRTQELEKGDSNE